MDTNPAALQKADEPSGAQNIINLTQLIHWGHNLELPVEAEVNGQDPHADSFGKQQMHTARRKGLSG